MDRPVSIRHKTCRQRAEGTVTRAAEYGAVASGVGVPSKPQERLAPIKVVDAVFWFDVDGLCERPNRQIVVQQIAVHEP